MPNELLDFETLIAVKRAAPRVTIIPFDLARMVVRGMDEFAAANRGNVDPNGQAYWQTTVRELTAGVASSEAVSFNQVGRACRDMGLELWRKGDGYHVAWSAAQLKILKEHFNP